MDLLNRAFTQLHDLFRALTPGSRLAVGSLLVVAAIGAVYLCTSSAAAPDVELLAGKSLTATQLQAVKEAFKKANLKTYVDRGTAILVPRGEEAAYRAALAEAKVLSADSGSALHDAIESDSPYVSDKWQREQRMKIALQDELGQTIRSMSGVESAKVLYDVEYMRGLNREKQFTATVSVRLAASLQAEDRIRKEIKQLVAGSIAGLKPENVTVINLNPTEPVVAKAPDDQPAQGAAESTQPNTAAWLAEHAGMLAFAVLALAGMFVLGWIVRVDTAETRGKASFASVASRAKEPSAKDSAAASSHRAPHTRPNGVAGRNELSEIVRQDPKAAANILRAWIGTSG